MKKVVALFTFLVCSPASHALEYGVGLSRLTPISNNGEFFKKETPPPNAVDIFIETSKPLSPYFHVLFLDRSANQSTITVFGIKYKFGGKDNSLGGSAGINLFRFSFGGDIRYYLHSMVYSAYLENSNWGDEGYGSYGIRVGRKQLFYGW